MAEIVIVTGTDTGVGKTFVTAELTRWLRGKGVNAIAVKPVETGWIAATSDAAVLAAASGRTLEQTIWRHFQLPAAPKVAAEAEGQALDELEMIDWIRAAAEGTDICFVEGAGGWLVPFGPDWMLQDILTDLQALVMIVGRASLGTINHSLLTIQAIQYAAKVPALVLSVLPSDDPQVAHSNRRELETWTEVPVLLLPDEIDRLGSQFHVELTRADS